ncbi:MAG: hypothetical protein EBZ48_15575, partial [Proteobacteria bacterium]|nr:hypothetical protein [Pseudomonadota bacterium]
MWALAAPEYSEGEDLLASAYRGLLLGIQDNAVNKRWIKDLPAAVNDEFGGPMLWEELLRNSGGLTSPPRKETRSAPGERLPELMPFVPKVGYYAGVRGKFGRGRWYPANLLLQVFGAGLGYPAGTVAIRNFSETLNVGVDDDVVARFIEKAIPAMSPPSAAKPLSLSTENCVAFGRSLDGLPPRIPAEAFCCDVASLNGLKRKLTRRQWTVLCEALIRLGLATHVLWVCHVNSESWDILLDVAAGGGVPSTTQIQKRIWCEKT